MFSFVNDHLSQRKSSLAKFSRLQNTKQLNEQREIKQSKQLRQKMEEKINSKSQNLQMKKIQNVYKNSEMKQKNLNQYSNNKDNTRLRDEESSDYIRNLYKKYLGKQNKQNQPFGSQINSKSNEKKPMNEIQQRKSKLDAFTQRKLRTTQSKQILSSKTNFRDYTKRALFAQNENQMLGFQVNKVKEVLQKQRISTMLKKQKNWQIQSQFQAKSLSNVKIFKQNMKTERLQVYDSKRPSKTTQFISRKGQTSTHNNEQKQTMNKKSCTKNYSSKSKPLKNQNYNQKVQKSALKRSNSTQIRKQSQNQNIYTKPSKLNNKIKQKNFTQIANVRTEYMNQQMRQKQESKQMRMKIEQNKLHPHRESYCQFDTQQQVQEKYGFEKKNLKAQYLKKQIKQQLLQRPLERNHKIKDNGQDQFIGQQMGKNSKTNNNRINNKGRIYERYLNDLQSLRFLVGEENSIYAALSRISKIKQASQQAY